MIPAVDWHAVLWQLHARGLPAPFVASRVGVARTTVLSWRDDNREPLHDKGERLIALWIASTGKVREQLPRVNLVNSLTED